MKSPVGVGDSKGAAVNVRWLQARGGREFSKKRGATFGRFAIRVGEIKGAVLR